MGKYSSKTKFSFSFSLKHLFHTCSFLLPSLWFFCGCSAWPQRTWKCVCGRRFASQKDLFKHCEEAQQHGIVGCWPLMEDDVFLGANEGGAHVNPPSLNPPNPQPTSPSVPPLQSSMAPDEKENSTDVLDPSLMLAITKMEVTQLAALSERKLSLLLYILRGLSSSKGLIGGLSSVVQKKQERKKD